MARCCASSEPGDDHLVAAALRVGAHGCLDKGVDGPALAQAVVASARGQAFLSGDGAAEPSAWPAPRRCRHADRPGARGAGAAREGPARQAHRRAS